MQNLSIVQPGEKKTRKMRMPNFPLEGGINAQGLYPYFAHPVLPGETLDSHNLKATMISAPLASPLAGAWLESWLFYVRLTDIDNSLGEMFIGNLTDSSSYQAAADQPQYFTKAGQIEWIKLATERIHEIYFRDEDETAVMHPDGVPMIKRINSDAFESAVHDDTATGDELGDSEGEEISPQLYAYMRMREMGMGMTSYEDYLKTYGLSQNEPAAKRGEPELLAYRRYWTLPSNTIDPSDGSPTGAWYWRLDEKNEKNKRFTEPGYVIGLWAIRPKFLDAKLLQPYATTLWGFENWIPSYTLSDPSAGLRKVDIDNQPWVSEAMAATHNIWFDHRDALSHGEQFRNGGGRYTPPLSNGREWSDTATKAELRGEYVLSTDIDALWSDNAVAEGADYDGICSLKVKGHVQDNT